jgi:hypothetical protein
LYIHLNILGTERKNVRRLAILQNPAFINFDWEEDSNPHSHICGPATRAILSETPERSNGTAEERSSAAHSIAVHMERLSKEAAASDADVTHTRRLLNLEKIMFVADDQGLAPGLLLIRAGREGYHRDGPAGGLTSILYNIGVDRIHVLPLFIARKYYWYGEPLGSCVTTMQAAVPRAVFAQVALAEQLILALSFVSGWRAFSSVSLCEYIYL